MFLYEKDEYDSIVISFDYWLFANGTKHTRTFDVYIYIVCFVINVGGFNGFQSLY